MGHLRACAIATRLQDAVIGEIGAFRDSSNPEILPLMQRHLADIAAEPGRLPRGEALRPLPIAEQFAEHAAVREQAGAPNIRLSRPHLVESKIEYPGTRDVTPIR